MRYKGEAREMLDEILLSLCIPTNGIVEWVFPVLESIYEEEHPLGKFEVIVTDNGDNKDFQKKMEEYAKDKNNLIYKKTDAALFLNQIEAFQLASGKLIKFINHRMKLKKGTLNYLLNFVRLNEKSKPVTFFLNQADPGRKISMEYNTFDAYVRGLSYWASWSGGTAMWKSDFEQLDITQKFDPLFPHTNLIFAVTDRKSYIIDNAPLVEEMDKSHANRGAYDIFHAFAVGYVDILEALYQKKLISETTLKKLKHDNLLLVMTYYILFVILKQPCSYDLSGYEKAINVYYNRRLAFLAAIESCVKGSWRKCRAVINQVLAQLNAGK
jgi:glycosyltransferase involved in cell wall biosynthesis